MELRYNMKIEVKYERLMELAAYYLWHENFLGKSYAVIWPDKFYDDWSGKQEKFKLKIFNWIKEDIGLAQIPDDKRRKYVELSEDFLNTIRLERGRNDN